MTAITLHKQFKDVEEQMNLKLVENHTKYVDSIIVLVVINIAPEQVGKKKYSIGLGGSLAISVTRYRISPRDRHLIVTRSKDPAQRMWFNDDQVLNLKFNAKLVKKVVDKVLKGELSTNPFKVYNIDIVVKSKC